MLLSRVPGTKPYRKRRRMTGRRQPSDTRPVRCVPSTAPIDLAQNTSAQDSSGKDAAAPKEAAPESYPEDTEPATEKMQQQADEWNGGAAPGKPLKPLGFAGTSPPRLATPAWSRDSDFIPIEDRWRIGFPTWDRYKEGTPGEYPYTLGHWWDPYDQKLFSRVNYFDLRSAHLLQSDGAERHPRGGSSAADRGAAVGRSEQ